MTTTRPLTADLLPDVERLFATSKVTAGCSCMWFLLTSREFDSGYAGGNRAAFATLVPEDTLGVLAYHDGEPVGWVATGPRSRYGRLLRSPLLKGRDVDEDGSTWVVPCFFVRRDARRQGVTDDLLAAAVDLAAARGARSVEAVPLAGPGPHPTMAAYVGTESMFANAGFEVTARPSPARVIMRRALAVV
jgi:GNAT superfamily N-acetyltransferase